MFTNIKLSRQVENKMDVATVWSEKRLTQRHGVAIARGKRVLIATAGNEFVRYPD